MTRDEIKKVLMILDATYPNYKMEASKIKFTIETWFMLLEEYQYSEVSQALKNYILTDVKGFAPTIGQLVDMIHKNRKLSEGNEMSEIEAWGLVYKAICNSNYNSKEEFEKLPKIIQKILGNPATLKEMAQMESDTVMSVEQSHFIRNYRTQLEREKELSKMPEEQRIRLEGIQRKAIGE